MSEALTSFVNMLGDRLYASQFTSQDVGIVVHVAGVPGSADGNVDVTMQTLTEDSEVLPGFPRVATSPEPGIYEVTLSSMDTSKVGYYRLIWTYEVNSEPQMYAHMVEVGAASQAYDGLSVEMQSIIEGVWIRFADLFDSAAGGPHLQTYFQTNFGRGRMAQLLGVALGRLNTAAQPFTTYSPYAPDDGGSVFPVTQWGPLLSQALYVEVIKHLIRSYTEQPNTIGVSVAHLDRRDYMNRWETVLRLEQGDLDAQLDGFKISHMGLGRPRVLVGGGVFRTYGPKISISARARYPILRHY